MKNRYGTIYNEQDLPKFFINVKDSFSTPMSLLLDCEFAYGEHGDLYKFLSARTTDDPGLTLHIFDILYNNNIDIRPLSLQDRLTQLTKVIQPTDNVKLVDLYTINKQEEIQQTFDMLVTKGYEGAVVKTNSPYTNGVWVKLKQKDTLDLIIYAVPKKNIRNGIPYTFKIKDGEGKEMGSVSSGLSLGIKKTLLKPIKEDNEFVYIEPTLVEVEFQEKLFTDGNIRLRHPRMLRVRKDKPINEASVVREMMT
jgi:ATP-dependent DNA ligase